MMAAAEMFAGGVMMLAIAIARREWIALSVNPRTATALVYLTTIGAIGGFGSYV